MAGGRGPAAGAGRRATCCSRAAIWPAPTARTCCWPTASSTGSRRRAADPAHPRHRLHALLGDRGPAGPRPAAAAGGGRGQGLADGGDRRRRRAGHRPWHRPGPPFPRLWPQAGDSHHDRRHAVRGLLLGGAGGLAAPAAAARRRTALRWRMVTSWPRNLPGPGMTPSGWPTGSAQMSGGRLTVQLYAAGELVPALQVFDAVSAGTAEMAHTASFFWAGKMPGGAVLHQRAVRPAAARAHGLDRAWRRAGAVGRALCAVRRSSRSWPATPAPRWAAGSASEINGLADLQGLQASASPASAARCSSGWVRSDHGARACPRCCRRCRAAPSMPPSSWARAAISRPASTRRAPFTTGRACTSPTAPARPSSRSPPGQALPPDLQAVVDNACRAEAAYALAEAEWQRPAALDALVHQHGVKLRRFPPRRGGGARRGGRQLLAGFAADGAASSSGSTLLPSACRRARVRGRGCRAEAFLEARNGA